MEEMALELPRAKKDVWVRRRVVVVIAVGERSRSATLVQTHTQKNREKKNSYLHKKKNWKRKSRYSGML
jgi:hypothetical protein